MDIRPVTDQFAVSPQITQDDVAQIAAQGVRTLICNRPDGEEFGQDSFAAIAAAAAEAGMTARHIPIAGGFTPEAIAQTQTALRELEGPILAYCRTGTRSIMLWSAAMIGQMDPAQIAQAARQAGYDVSPLLGG